MCIVKFVSGGLVGSLCLDSLEHQSCNTLTEIKSFRKLTVLLTPDLLQILMQK